MGDTFGWTCDPGPCPIDDTPHTACTPESVALASSLSRQACAVALAPPRVLATFSTATYRTAEHGPDALRAKAAGRPFGAPVRVAPVQPTPVRPRVRGRR
jgi:hypothetical protein